MASKLLWWESRDEHMLRKSCEGILGDGCGWYGRFSTETMSEEELKKLILQTQTKWALSQMKKHKCKKRRHSHGGERSRRKLATMAGSILSSGFQRGSKWEDVVFDSGGNEPPARHTDVTSNGGLANSTASH